MIFRAADLDRWLPRYERLVDVPYVERLAAHIAAIADLRARAARSLRSNRTAHLPTARSTP